MSDAVSMEQALQNYAANYFINGGMPYGILKIHRPEITQAQADQAKSDWIAKYSGAPTPAVLNELTDFTPLAYRPVDSQMIESRQHGLIMMALAWGIPPSKLGASVGGGTYRNAQMEEVQARNDAVAPWTTLLEQAISLDWLPRGQKAEWDLGASLRTDTLSQYQAYQAAMGGPGPQSAWMLQDEVRAQNNMDPMAIVAAQVAKEVAAAGVEAVAELPAVPTNTPPRPGGPETATPYPAGDTVPAPPANAGPPGGK
jgi:HK97 family phage portal protein